jgi:hypothetical protein
MRLHFLNATKLSEDLAQERLAPKDKAFYFLAGIIFATVLNYSTFMFANSISTWIGLFEFLLIIIVTIFGFLKCYNASIGANNQSFISDFICLSLPIGVTTTVVAWAIYWGTWKSYQILVTSISIESQNAADLLVWINNELPWPTVLLTVVVSNAVFYLRMASYLNRVVVRRLPMSAS